MIPARFAPVLQEMEPLASLFRQAGHRLYLVGGTVRDLLLGDEAKPLDQMDFDATTTATPDETKKLVAGIADAVWTQGERFGTIGLKVGERVYEITTHRAEAYSPESRKPDVVFAPDIETDLSRRDFTINAMALELTGDAPVLVDPYGGAADLMTRLWFLIDTGLVDSFFPEISAMRLEQDPIHRHKDVLTHTVAVVENVRPDASPGFDFRITRLAALFHDIGKPKTRGFRSGKGVTFHHHEVVGARMTRDRMRALKYPNEDVDAVSELVNLHLRFHTYQMGWTDSAVRRYVRDAGPLLAELNVLTRCDCTTRNEKKAAVLARRMDELEERIAALAEREEIAAMRPEIDGVRVMELLGIPGGPAVGDALDHLMEIRMEEGLIGEEAATARLLAWWEENKDKAGTQRRPRRRPAD